MSCSKKTFFLPSRNVMSSGWICFSNSPVVFIVARIVSPVVVWLCWNSKIGEADAIEIRNKNSKNVVPPFIVVLGLGD